ALQAGHVPVDLAGVENRVAAPADVDERRLHAGQYVLHLAEVHVADHAAARRAGDVVLDEHAVLQHRDLRTVAALADRHHPVDRLATGQELRLGQDRRPGTPLLPTVPAALALGFEPGRPGDALHLVPGGTRLADLDNGDDAVLGLDVLGTGATAAALAP